MLQWALLNMSLCTGVSISLGFISEMEMLGQMAHECSNLLNTDCQAVCYSGFTHLYIIPPAARKNPSNVTSWLRLGFVQTLQFFSFLQDIMVFAFP